MGRGCGGRAVGAAGAPFLVGQNLVTGTAISAVLGVGSVAAGGKFADGAVTASFGYLFNDVAVAIGARRSDSFNAFGHASLGVEGFGVFSFGTGTALGSDFDEFFASQSDKRGQQLFTIKTTPEQDLAMVRYLYTQEKGIGVCFDNCADRVLGALKAAGIAPSFFYSMFPITTPANIGNWLRGYPGAQYRYVPANSSSPNLTRFNPAGWP